MLVAFAAALGASVGSFLNLCAARWPADESVVAPRSRCDACQAALRWSDKLPVVGYALARGQCRRCGARVSILHPLVEVGGAAIWGGMALWWGVHPEALRGAVFLSILLGIAVADARTYIIPNQLSLGGAAVGGLLAALPGGPTPAGAAVGAAAGFGVLWTIAVAAKALMGRDAMGGGDIKMMALVGAFVGPAGALLTLFAGSVLGAAVFGPAALRTGKPVPFGVFLALGAAIAYLWGDAVVDWYAGMLGG